MGVIEFEDDRKSIMICESFLQVEGKGLIITYFRFPL